MADRLAHSREGALSLTKPVLGLAVGGALGLLGIAAALSLLVVLRAGMASFLDIMIPGMLLGAIVGFATQRFGRTGVPAAAAR
jgi:hypothetical protein